MTDPEAAAAALSIALLESSRAVVAAARAYALITHGNLSGDAYLRREEARETLRDALATLDLLEKPPSQ